MIIVTGIDVFLRKAHPLPADILLITPPFTQLNTPYPATAYLKGFLQTRGFIAEQCDLGIDTMLRIFSRSGITALFREMGDQPASSPNIARIIALQYEYIRSIDDAIRYLQGRNPTLAHRIAQRNLLPEAGRFAQVADLEWAFGTMGVQDKARHIATLFLEDLSDLIRETTDPWFGFTRYAERIARSAERFDALEEALQGPESFTDRYMLEILRSSITETEPAVVALSVPFPGNLYAALRCGQWLHQHRPDIRVALGGGYANTELRSLKDPRVFKYVDFITLDDGEAPVEQLLRHVRGDIGKDHLKRTFTLTEGAVTWYDNRLVTDYKQTETGTPDYDGLPLDQYISAIEVLNPMHRLWSDGRWNKLTMAHGCYWGKCTFCDISLDYIKRYEPLTATILCDRMQELKERTGVNGFHFVDEAAPPSLMKALSLEILKRGMVVSWWTNIRFEKSFTRDLCQLLRRAGCIGVSGGLEVASDRLLSLIQKGITVEQVAKVNRHFTEAGIMVHAYLMYGFPSQSAQETIDSMEMVRQMFEAGILQSAYWHQFTMTAHSPVGMDPDAYGVKPQHSAVGDFARNDIPHEDPRGADHEQFAWGLQKSLLNWMHGHGIDQPLHKWFDFTVPRTSVPKEFMRNCLSTEEYLSLKPDTKWVWLGGKPSLNITTRTKKGNSWEVAELSVETPQDTLVIRAEPSQGRWLADYLSRLTEKTDRSFLTREAEEDYQAAGLEDFGLFWDNKPVNGLWKAGLLRV
jgi:hypothetical protein